MVARSSQYRAVLGEAHRPFWGPAFFVSNQAKTLTYRNQWRDSRFASFNLTYILVGQFLNGARLHHRAALGGVAKLAGCLVGFEAGAHDAA